MIRGSAAVPASPPVAAGCRRQDGRVASSTEHPERCIVTLESALQGLSDHQPDEIAYDVYRAASVKEFELILEQSGNRTAARHGLIEAAECERWLEYRDSRNDTARDCGEGFAESAVRRLPQFVLDARALARRLNERTDA